MDDFYANYIVRQYNATFKKHIVLACSCYQRYNDFVTHVFTKRNSYFCCILIVTSDNLSKVVHNSFPIMLGSEVDFSIRQMEKADCNMYGSFIIKGDYKLIPNFITNNLGTGHVYKTKGSTKWAPSKMYIVNLKQENVGVHVKYRPYENEDDRFDVTVSDELYVTNEANKRKLDDAVLLYDDLGESDCKRRKCNRFAYVADLRDRSEGVDWIAVMNRSSPVPEHTTFTVADYRRYFDACLKHAPDLDHLANKTSISPPTLLERVLVHLIRLCEVWHYDRDTRTVKFTTNKSKFMALSNKIKTIFSTGNMFFALSNKYTANVMKEYKCVYQAVDGQKLHLLSKMTSMVKRYVSDQARNSKALKYPIDAFGFIDPINAREMKGAGETIYQCQLVLTSPESDAAGVRRVLDRMSCDDGTLTVVWNGFLTAFKLKTPQLRELKQRCPFVSLMVFDDYLNVNTKGHVLMKYSKNYKSFVTPHEVLNLFHDAFEGYNMHLNFSSMAMMLPKSIVRAQPAKTVVAMSNIKGRCQTLNSKLALMSFLYTIGTSNAALIHSVEDGDDIVMTTLYGGGGGGGSKPVVVPINLKDPHRRYAKLAETSGDGTTEMPPELKELYTVYRPKTDGSELDALAYEDIVDNCADMLKDLDSIYAKWLDKKYMIYVPCPKFQTFEPNKRFSPVLLTLSAYNKVTKNDINATGPQETVEISKGVPIKIARCEELTKAYVEYQKIDPKVKTPAHMLLYCGFGDVGGGTNEDGIILDSTFVENGPRKLISITLSLKFFEKSTVFKKDANINNEYCRVRYTAINRTFDPHIVVGLLSSRQQLSVRRSKNVSVIESIVNTHYRYLILYKEYSEYAKTVESFYSHENSTVTMHMRYAIKLGVGSKIANVHGQKGVCSAVRDLSGGCGVSAVKDLSAYVGYRSDGVRVHPQILYSATSIVGRTVSSQVYELLCNDTVAFTVYGEPIALMAFNVHHIESSVKARVCITKNDLMAAENGFSANMMTNTQQCLADQGPVEHRNLFHFISQLNILNGVRLQFLDFDTDLMDDLDETSEDDDDDDDDDDDGTDETAGGVENTERK